MKIEPVLAEVGELQAPGRRGREVAGDARRGPSRLNPVKPMTMQRSVGFGPIVLNIEQTAPLTTLNISRGRH
jgi:hypothetical protein